MKQESFNYGSKMADMNEKRKGTLKEQSVLKEAIRLP
jgi:hypothetical protein